MSDCHAVAHVALAPEGGVARRRRTSREASFPLVPLHETQSQLVLAARSNRPYARARLIRSLMPRIANLARIYARVPGVDRSELLQEGSVGVLRALERYDAELGTPFWPYASWWVRQAMQQVVAELSRPVVLSDRALRQLARVRDARRTFALTHSREPTLRELASASELTLEQLHRLSVADRRPRSLEEPVGESGGAESSFGESLRDPRAEEPYDELDLRLGAAEIPRLLANLSERERVVICARYGLHGRQRTLRELGEILHVSAERVRQIEQGALERMRAAYDEDGGRPGERAGTMRTRQAAGGAVS